MITNYMSIAVIVIIIAVGKLRKKKARFRNPIILLIQRNFCVYIYIYIIHMRPVAGMYHDCII